MDETKAQARTWSGESYASTPLKQRVAEQLRTMIMSGELHAESQLPTEPELSSLLNVSRSTVRSALTILEQGGYVLRRRGIGTFVVKEPPTFTRLNVNSGVTQLIRSSGAEPGCAEVLVTSRPASAHVANRLALEPDTPLVTIERVRLANDRRVVFSLDYLPHSLFQLPGGEIPLKEIEAFIAKCQSMYAFLHQRLSLELHHGIAWIRPLVAGTYIAEKLQVPRDSSILYIEQVDYDANGVPLALADEYYAADAFAFSVFRSS